MTTQEPLTPRERECVAAYRQYGSEDAAARQLGISKWTVHRHLASARAKKNVPKTWMLWAA